MEVVADAPHDFGVARCEGVDVVHHDGGGLEVGDVPQVVVDEGTGIRVSEMFSCRAEWLAGCAPHM